MKISNSISSKIGGVFSIIIIICFQIYMYPSLWKQYRFLETKKRIVANVLKIDTNELVVEFDYDINNKLTRSRKIKEYNPFKKNVSTGETLVINFSKETNVLIFEGYDEEPLFLVLFLMFLFPIIAEILFLLGVFNIIEQKR